LTNTLLGADVPSANLGAILVKRLQIKGSSLRSRSLEYKIRLSKEFEQFAMPKFEEHKLKAVVSRVFPIEQVVEAHEFMEADSNIGKIILAMES